MRITTKQRIIEYLKFRGEVSGSELEGCAEAWETKASVISRRARELAHEGMIYRTLSPRKTVQYGINKYRPLSKDEANQLLRSLSA